MIEPTAVNTTSIANLDNSTTLSSLTTTELSSTEATPQEDLGFNYQRFKWTEHDKQLILGSFFWGYILTELPGGRLAELVGGHRVFGHSMLWASVLTLIIPFAANMGLYAMVTVRVLLGFMLGGEFINFLKKYVC